MSTKIAPFLIKGNVHSDQRGQLFNNNDFNALGIK